MAKSGEVGKEIIKVDPEGLEFHGVFFKSLEKIITYFKESVRTEQYQQYLKENEPLFFDNDNEEGAFYDGNDEYFSDWSEDDDI